MEPGGQDVSLKDFYTLSSGDHFVQWGETDWTILVKDLMRNICVKFKILKKNFASSFGDVI